MKRKLIAIFAACLTLACSFASCGSNDDDDSEKKSGKKNSSSDVSDLDNEDDDEKDSDKADDEEDDEDEEPATTKSKKDKENETAAPDEDEDDIDSDIDLDFDIDDGDSNSDTDYSYGNSSSIEGIWEGNVDGDSARYIFDNNGKFSMSMTWGEYLHMEGSTCYVGDEDVTDYLSFDGSNFILEEGDMEVINMKKTKSGSSNDFNGEYVVKSGYLADLLDSSFGSTGISISIIFDGDETFFSLNDLADYSVSGDTITITNMPEAMTDGTTTSAEMYFEISGNSLSITDTDGEVLHFTRVK